MAVDTFICGECQLAFHDITLFIQHKKDGCSGTGLALAEDGAPQLLDMGGNQVYIIHESADGTTADVEAFFGQLENQVEQEGTYLLENNAEPEVPKEEVQPQPTLELVPVSLEESSTGDKSQDGFPNAAPVDFQLVLKPPHMPGRGGGRGGRGGGRKRGRPRKSDTKVVQEATQEKATQKNVLPEKGPDGMFTCVKCKKGFRKERHYTTHRCYPNTDYVAEIDQDMSPDEMTDNIDDDGVEFRPAGRPFGRRGRGRPRKSGLAAQVVTSSSLQGSQLLSNLESQVSLGQHVKHKQVPKLATLALRTAQAAFPADDPSVLQVLCGNAGIDPNHLIQASSGEADQQTTVVVMGESGDQQAVMTADGKPTKGNLGMVTMAATSSDAQQMVSMALSSEADEGGKTPDMPIFTDEADKIAFEDALAVDYGKLVSNLYKMHVIEQNVNEHAPAPYNRTSSVLTVFSCNFCEKVFMSLSQVRIHCLSHTQHKPFKCFKCDYATNCKGNLYTHMRKHTGQLFQCSRCDFKSANRTHVREHEDTHVPGKRNKCRICRRNYKTVKSLINHIRKYHGHNKSGEAYLNELQGKHKKGPALIHQCHVCNRKFKKKIDRDRHLIVHNIQSSATYVCKLCSYACTRRDFFLRHILGRHRVIYRCSLCTEEFPSCIRLGQHLAETHARVQDEDAEFNQLFEACINLSFVLPEPDGTMDKWGIDNADSHEDAASGGTSVTPGVDIEAEDATEVPDAPNVPCTEALMKSVLDQAGSLPLQTHTLTEEATFVAIGYKSMSLEVLEKLRDTFGNDECEHCGRLFFYKTDFESHSRVHTREKPYQCSQCEFRGGSQEVTRRHILRVHDKVQYVCSDCSESFSTVTEFSLHMQTAHTDQTTTPSPKQVQCSMCELSFDSLKRMKIHLQVKHSELTSEEMRKCLSPYQRPSSRIGRKLYKCPYCDKSYFRGASDLQCHLWIHQGLKPYKCPVENCSYACRSKSNLSTHLLRHSSRKPFNCSVCNKAYKSRTALRWHVRSHKDGKLFKCSKCTYAASQKSHLVRHMETHNLVKRFRCEHCSYSANTVGYMKVHYTRQHKGSQYIHQPQLPAKKVPLDTKVYSCLSCDYMFGNLSDMKRHLRTRHHLANEDMTSLEKLDMGNNSLITNIAGETEVETNVVEDQEGRTLLVGQGLPEANSSEGLVEEEQGMEGMEEEGVEVLCGSQDEGNIQVLGSNSVKLESSEQHATVALQTLHYSGKEEQGGYSKQMDVFQQFINLQHEEGGVEAAGSGLVQGDVVTIDNSDQHPQTIIVQQNQEVVLTGSDEMGEEQRYVIQYVGPDGTTATVHEITVPSTHPGMEEMLSGTSMMEQQVGAREQHIVTMETSQDDDVDDANSNIDIKVEVQETPSVNDDGRIQVAVLHENH